ncbi:hypothetical protein HaloA020_35260 [Halomonas sp. A020]|uniref:hypothetical protein n=1 Tax=Halomonas sp. A020 TaxID=2717374 RepID=UPI0024910AFC|nr:hypothetical protein [Halomonas sp. A020]BCB62825.1 hypothetical protein HaloA020_35260 [Halomonas sp. A020]
MNSVTFPEALGGNGQTYTDDADPNTGLDGLGYTVRFIPCLQQAVIMGLSAQSNAQACADYVQQCQTLREEVGNDRLAVAADRQHVDQQRQAVDTAAASAAQSAASVNADNIVHKPGSGLPNAAGAAYNREVEGGDGPLMAKGFGGLGGQGYQLSDFNAAPSANQFYYGAGASGSNDLLGAKYWPGVDLYRLSSGHSIRLMFSNLGAFIRGWVAEDLSFDFRIFHDKNVIGTVSQSGGVPTGAIIERGSNANGEYVKFADGSLFFSSVKDVNVADSGVQFFTPPVVYIPGSAPAITVAHVSTSSPNPALYFENIRALFLDPTAGYALRLKTAGVSSAPGTNSERLIFSGWLKWY